MRGRRDLGRTGAPYAFSPLAGRRCRQADEVWMLLRKLEKNNV
jgi:hypothetical protein